MATATNAATAETNQRAQASQISPQIEGNQAQQERRDQERGRQDMRLASRDAPFFMSPFALLQRFFTDDIGTLLDEFTTGGRILAKSPQLQSQQQRQGGAASFRQWMPRIDVVQRGNDLVVRGDLPGVNPDDVVVEIGDNAITISGERQQEQTGEQNGVYRVERVYGSFFREIPLPEGVIADQAKATFKDGVLEITVPAPPEQVSRGRRLQIERAEHTKQGRNQAER